MKAKHVLLTGVCAVLLGAACVQAAPEQGGGEKNRRRELMQRRNELRRELGKIERTAVAEDPEVQALKEAAKAAQQAYRGKVQEKLKANEQGAAILTEMEQVDQQIRDLSGKKAREDRPKDKAKGKDRGKGRERGDDEDGHEEDHGDGHGDDADAAEDADDDYGMEEF